MSDENEELSQKTVNTFVELIKALSKEADEKYNECRCGKVKKINEPYCGTCENMIY